MRSINLHVCNSSGVCAALTSILATATCVQHLFFTCSAAACAQHQSLRVQHQRVCSINLYLCSCVQQQRKKDRGEERRGEEREREGKRKVKGGRVGTRLLVLNDIVVPPALGARVYARRTLRSTAAEIRLAAGKQSSNNLLITTSSCGGFTSRKIAFGFFFSSAYKLKAERPPAAAAGKTGGLMTEYRVLTFGV